MKTQLKTRPLLVKGDYLTWAIRSARDPREFCKQIAPTLTVEQVDKIATRHAHIEGDSNHGFEYVENDE